MQVGALDPAMAAQDAGPAIPRLIPRALLQLLAWVFAVSAIGTALIVQASGLSIAWDDFSGFVLLVPLLLVLAAFCDWRYPDKRLAHCAAIVALAVLALLLCGIASNAGLRLRMPLADSLFASIDAAVGHSVAPMIHFVAAHASLAGFLNAFYQASSLIAVAAILGAALKLRTRLAWELAATTFVSMQIVALASPWAPAWGAMHHFGLQGLQGHGLPPGAGVYQWPAFAHFYAGTDPLIHLADLGGVVAFPSFHTVLGLVGMQAVAASRWRLWGIFYAAAVMTAAVPMGGHYVTDLIGGALVWMVAAALVRRVNNPSG